MKRFFMHLFHNPLQAKKLFSGQVMKEIESMVRASELKHGSEIKVIIEVALNPFKKMPSPRERALELFSTHKVWDTEHNCGVLLYLLFADRAIELIADRGIVSRVSQVTWNEICAQVEEGMRGGSPLEGIRSAIDKITSLLATHFPREADDKNELSDAPEII